MIDSCQAGGTSVLRPRLRPSPSTRKLRPHAGSERDPEGARSGREAVSGADLAAPVHLEAEQHEQLWHDLDGAVPALGAGDQRVPATSWGASFSPRGSRRQRASALPGHRRPTAADHLDAAALRAARQRPQHDPQAIERYDEIYLINKFHQGEAAPARCRPKRTGRVPSLGHARADNGAGDDISRAYRFYARAALEPEDGDGARPRTARRGSSSNGWRSSRSHTARRQRAPDLPVAQRHRRRRSTRPTSCGTTSSCCCRLGQTSSTARCGARWSSSSVSTTSPASPVSTCSAAAGTSPRTTSTRATKSIDPISHDEDKVEARSVTSRVRAKYYKRLIDPASEPDPRLAPGCSVSRAGERRPAHPVLMVALDLHERGVIDVEELRQVVALIESFFVRRQLARIPTNALNRVFVQLIDTCRTTTASSTRCIASCRATGSTGRAMNTSARRSEAQPFFHIGRWHQRKHDPRTARTQLRPSGTSTSRRPTCRSSTSCPDPSPNGGSTLPSLARTPTRCTTNSSTRWAT